MEQAGQNLGSLLVKSTPWAGTPCEEDNCLLCKTKLKTGKNLAQDCTKRNLTYQTWCQTCLDQDGAGKSEEEIKTLSKFTYIAETAKSAKERGSEHLYDMKMLSISSHMLAQACCGQASRDGYQRDRLQDEGSKIPQICI